MAWKNIEIVSYSNLAISMLKLLSSKAQELKKFWNRLNPVMFVFIGKLELSTNIYMNTQLPGFQSFQLFFTLFCIDQISHQQLLGLNTTSFCVSIWEHGNNLLFLQWEKDEVEIWERGLLIRKKNTFHREKILNLNWVLITVRFFIFNQ